MASIPSANDHAREQQNTRSDAVTAAENKLRAERKRHYNDTTMLRKNIADLQTEVKNLSVNFDEVNRKLIAMSPKAHVSDGEIADAYKELCQDIEDWVDKHHADDDHSPAPVLSTESLDSGSIDAELIFGNESELEILRACHHCKDHILMKLIMRFLFDNLLRRTCWVPGLSTEQEQVLQIAMDNLPCAIQDGGFDARNSWRSSTYRGLAASPKLQKLGEDHLKQLTTQLSSTVSSLSEVSSDGKESQEKDLTKLVQKAAELAKMMRLCPVQYCFVYAFSNTESQLLKASAVNKYDIIDMMTGHSVGEECFRQKENNDVIGQLVTVILPNLVKLNSDGTVVKLANGALLAKLDVQEEKKQQDNHTARVSGTEENASVAKRTELKDPSTTRPISSEHKTWASLLRR